MAGYMVACDMPGCPRRVEAKSAVRRTVTVEDQTFDVTACSSEHAEAVAAGWGTRPLFEAL